MTSSGESPRAWYRYWQRPSFPNGDSEGTSVRRRPKSVDSSSRNDASRQFHVKPDGPPPHAKQAAASRGSLDEAIAVQPNGYESKEADGASATRASESLKSGERMVIDPRRFERARVVVIANQKGGVGKTTTAVSLAAALAQAPARVLLVDLDPQGNATSGVGVRLQPGSTTVYEVLANGAPVEDAVEPTSVRNLFLLPSTLDLAGAEVELVSAFSREQKLRRALDPIRDEYDIILVDCPPSLGLLTVNALAAGDQVLVPVQCEYYALEGLGAFRRNAALVQADLNPQLEIIGFVLTMHDGRTRLSEQVGAEMRAHFGDLVFDTCIPRSVRLAEAPSFGQPITVFDPSSRGAVAYYRLAAELIERLIDPPTQPVHAGAIS